MRVAGINASANRRTAKGTSLMDIALGTWRLSIRRCPPTTADLVQIYNDTAGYWQAALRMLRYPDAYGDLFARLRADGSLATLAEGGQVLDCGLGTGALSCALLQSLKVPIEIAGVDLAPEMLPRAREAIARAHGSVQLHCGGACDLPFTNDTFPLVMSAHMLEHLPDPYAGIRELYRVVQPGGALLLVVTRPGICDALLRLKWRHARIAPEQLPCWMGDVGLTDLHVYPLGAQYCIPRATSIAFLGRKDRGATS